MRYSPEDSSFDSTDEWELHDTYDKNEMVNLIGKSVSNLSKAREYANKNGNSKWYHLLNAVIGELADVLEKEHGTGERWMGGNKWKRFAYDM